LVPSSLTSYEVCGRVRCFVPNDSGDGSAAAANDDEDEDDEPSPASVMET
jgi:hypothetical protein